MALASRQFVEMPRTRIEGLLASFPKLVVPGQQHTTVETEAIRYVYQPIGEDMYAVLITGRQNNIVQDMGTLHLVARAVSDICGVGDQQDVVQHGFDLVLAFDEIISQGLRDNVDLAKLRTIMEMESHEERIQEIIERNKEREAKEELKRHAKMFDQQRREAAKRGMLEPGMGGSMLGGGRMGGSYEPLLAREPEPVRSFAASPAAAAAAAAAPSIGSGARGMRLGRKPRGADLLGALGDEVGLAQDLAGMAVADPVAAAPLAAAAAAAVAPAGPAALPADMKGVHVQIEEHITAIVNRDGGLEQMEVKGDLSLVVSDEAYSSVVVRVAAGSQQGAQVKTHPKIDKRRFQSESEIALKDAAGTFPLAQAIGVLKWRIASSSEDAVPLTINCWPSPTGSGSVDVNIEYELTNTKLVLDGVVVAIPIPPGAQPTVSDVDGAYTVNRARGLLEWQIASIDATNASGSLDFSVPGDDAGAFFPVAVSFASSTPYFDIEVTAVATPDGQDADFSRTVSLVPDQYAVI
ncbi:coatomer subunit delta [Coemansia javaensis]|uniref:Coatomer subunit delta n=1 Tax=Coemansia javaensis TaxID=2761396 RepID=A0A9W8LL24_9FUNG|nr:coatomer subunit delta [Coemansia javaensis]